MDIRYKARRSVNVETSNEIAGERQSLGGKTRMSLLEMGIRHGKLLARNLKQPTVVSAAMDTVTLLAGSVFIYHGYRWIGGFAILLGAFGWLNRVKKHL